MIHVKFIPRDIAVNILSRAATSFDEVKTCICKGDYNGARNAIEYWQTVVCSDDAAEINNAKFSRENVALVALEQLYKTTASLRFDLLAERPARAELSAFRFNKQALCEAERVLKGCNVPDYPAAKY